MAYTCGGRDRSPVEVGALALALDTAKGCGEGLEQEDGLHPSAKTKQQQVTRYQIPDTILYSRLSWSKWVNQAQVLALCSPFSVSGLAARLALKSCVCIYSWSIVYALLRWNPFHNFPCKS